MRCPGRASRRWASSSKNLKVVRERLEGAWGGGVSHEVRRMMGHLRAPVRTFPFT